MAVNRLCSESVGLCDQIRTEVRDLIDSGTDSTIIKFGLRVRDSSTSQSDFLGF